MTTTLMFLNLLCGIWNLKIAIKGRNPINGLCAVVSFTVVGILFTSFAV